jgi:signal transduction histidine kinase/streptogramin lyase
LPARPVPGIFADADGTLWLGMGDGGGLVHFDPARGVLQRYVNDPLRAGSLGHDFVRNLTRGRDGSLWAATNGGGLAHMMPGADTFARMRHDGTDPDSLASDTLIGVFEDSHRTLWVYTLDRGVDERCAGCDGFRHHRHDPADPASIGDNSVSHVMETRSGELWMGTRGGLQRYDRESGRFERFVARADDPASLSSNSVSTLLEDSRGQLWIGTQGGGLNRRIVHSDGSTTFEVIDVRSGLGANAIGAIVEDRAGRIWVSTTAGISRIDPQGGIINFGAPDGTQEGGYWLNSAAELPDGRIAFGGLDGVTLFDPAAVTAPATPRPLVTGLLLRNVPTEPNWRDPSSPLAGSLWRGRAVTLAHDQDNVTFEFGALAFADPDSILYAYRLDPHDEKWIDTPATRRLATYTDLAPGSYTLSVRARRAGGDWSAPAVVDVAVRTAPWASPAARALYALALFALATLVGMRLRANLLERRANQRAIRISEERLKLALWGSGSELWDVDIVAGTIHRDNQLDHLEITHENGDYRIADLRKLVHPDDMPRFERALNEHLRGNAPSFEASYRTLDRGGQWAWLLTRGRVVQRDAGGRALRMTGTTSDITALNQALAALRVLNEQLEFRVEQRTAALQNANVELRTTLERLTQAQRQLFESEKLASLGGMVAGIAHEINTPLGIGVTAASHLREEARRLLARVRDGACDAAEIEAFRAMACESSDLILRNLQRADRLVRSFKCIAVDQSSEDRRVVDLGASLDEILTTLGPSLKKLPHRVEIECPPGIVVETAPGALYQIVTNLVMNSLAHGFAPGVAGSILVRAHRDGHAIVIEYADNGRGMDDTVRARIYEPFYTTQRGQGGSGLGMHIVYTLVTQVLGGSIECHSVPGQGTRFLIRFPERMPGSASVRA